MPHATPAAFRRRGRNWLIKSVTASDRWRGQIATALLAFFLRRRRFHADLLFATSPRTTFRGALAQYFSDGEPHKPHPLFDPLWYRSRYPDTTVMPALVHYLFFGFAEGRSPHPAVDPELCRRSYANAFAFLSIGIHSLADMNPFLEGRSDDLLRVGSVDGFLTEYFDADWLRKSNAEFIEGWKQSVGAHDAGIAMHPLSAWLAELRKSSIPPSPYVFRAAGAGPITVGLVKALEAERPGSRCVQLELSGSADASHATYSAARVPTADRLVLVRSDGPDGCLLGHHDELFRTLADPTIGVKSQNFVAAGDRYVLLAPMPDLEIDGRLIHLMHEHSSNYFHAMVEVVARFIRLRQDRPDLLSRAALLVDDAMPFVTSHLLERIARPECRIHFVPRGRSIATQTLVYPRETAFLPDVYVREPRVGEHAIDQAALEILAQVTLDLYPGADGRAPTGSKVLILRRSSRRRLWGEEKLANILQQRGFEVYAPTSSTPLEEQIRVFRTADLVVAATGAALTNLVFMRPGSRAVCLSSRQASLALTIWDQLANVAGVALKHVRSAVRYAPNRVQEMYHHHDYDLDVGQVLEAIR